LRKLRDPTISIVRQSPFIHFSGRPRQVAIWPVGDPGCNFDAFSAVPRAECMASTLVRRTFSFNRASLTGRDFATGKGGLDTLSSGILGNVSLRVQLARRMLPKTYVASWSVVSTVCRVLVVSLRWSCLLQVSQSSLNFPSDVARRKCSQSNVEQKIELLM
jgi:hypothetical protein